MLSLRNRISLVWPHALAPLGERIVTDRLLLALKSPFDCKALSFSAAILLLFFSVFNYGLNCLFPLLIMK